MHADLSALNRQAITAAKAHMGSIAWPTIVLLALVIGGFLANLWLFAEGLIPLWLAVLVYAVFTYMAYTPLHESVHGNIHGASEQLEWLNDLCGYLAGAIMLVPYRSHKVEHFTHHRYTNQPDKDPDFVVSGMRNGLGGLLVTGVRFFWLQTTYFARNAWSGATNMERVQYGIELLVALGWRAALLVLLPGWETIVLLVAGYLLGGYFTAYWFAYRPHLPYQNPARYQNTNSLIMPVWMKPLEWFWLGQNLHSIHHLFPRVPFYRYHALHREIEPVLRAHGTPIIGLYSREPVSPSAGEQALAGYH